MMKTKLLAKIRSGAAIVDVRSPEEFSCGAYPGARNLPLPELEYRLDELGPKDGPVVVYCASGMRSAKAARLLAKAGFTDVTDAGGMNGIPR